MLIKYKYRLNPYGKNVGWYQCDEEDFKKFWAKVPKEDIFWLKVQRGKETWFWAKYVGGWKKISPR